MLIVVIIILFIYLLYGIKAQQEPKNTTTKNG